MSKLETKLSNLEQAVARLGEVIPSTGDKVWRDAAIKRFEFTFELTWKTLQAAIEKEGLVASGSPKETLRQAYALGWIHEEKVWLDMLDDRNLSTHAYDEKIAARIAADLPAYYPILQGVMDLLRSKYPEF